MQHPFASYDRLAHFCRATKTNFLTRHFTFNLTSMRNLLSLALLTLLFASCDKEDVPLPEQPAMRYTDLQNTAVTENDSKRIDLDNDGRNDVLFKAEWV